MKKIIAFIELVLLLVIGDLIGFLIIKYVLKF